MNCNRARGKAARRLLLEDIVMRKVLTVGALCAALAIFTTTAHAAKERTLTGAAIGAGAGAIVLGPIGAVAGGAIGAWIGGPKLSRSYKECWYDRNGNRHCRWR